MGGLSAQTDITRRLSFQSTFAFGDRVRFNSAIQNCSGLGTIVGMTINEQLEVVYMIKFSNHDSPDVQPGILEQEIVLLESNAQP
jgi:hypothetical protein